MEIEKPRASSRELLPEETRALFLRALKGTPWAGAQIPAPVGYCQPAGMQSWLAERLGVSRQRVQAACRLGVTRKTLAQWALLLGVADG